MLCRPKHWGEMDREGTLGGELCMIKGESTVHLNFTQEPGPCPAYRAYTESQFHSNSTNESDNKHPTQPFISFFLRQIFSSEPIQNNCFWKPPFQLLMWITKGLTALLRVITETTSGWHFSFYELGISRMNTLPWSRGLLQSSDLLGEIKCLTWTPRLQMKTVPVQPLPTTNQHPHPPCTGAEGLKPKETYIPPV